MICDSTNVLVEGSSGSEAEVRQSLDKLIGEFDQRIAVACFASNLARIESVTRAALAHDRHVGLVGRSLWRMVEAAQETGYLKGLPDFLEEGDIGHLPRDKVLMICTGSQGEPRSALARIARGEHPDVALEAGDAAIFSSRIIPGNEHSIGELHNALIHRGVRIITERDHFIHVSGHPARDDLADMYRWIKPRIAVPVHGELRHLRAHIELAQGCQVREALLAENGTMIRLAPGPGEIVGQVDSGRLGLDGKMLVPLEGASLKVRQRMAFNGTAVATLVMNSAGKLLGRPQITIHGLAGEDSADEAVLAAATAAGKAVGDLSAAKLADDAAVREVARVAIRRSLHCPFRQEAGHRRASGADRGLTGFTPRACNCYPACPQGLHGGGGFHGYRDLGAPVRTCQRDWHVCGLCGDAAAKGQCLPVRRNRLPCCRHPVPPQISIATSARRFSKIREDRPGAGLAYGEGRAGCRDTRAGAPIQVAMPRLLNQFVDADAMA